MSIVIEDIQIERLAQQIAAAEGVRVVDVFRESLAVLADMRGLSTHEMPLRERLAILAREVDAIPPRAPAQALGADETPG